MTDITELAQSQAAAEKANLGEWWAVRGSNPRQRDQESSALPAELTAHKLDGGEHTPVVSRLQ